MYGDRRIEICYKICTLYSVHDIILGTQVGSLQITET